MKKFVLVSITSMVALSAFAGVSDIGSASNECAKSLFSSLRIQENQMIMNRNVIESELDDEGFKLTQNERVNLVFKYIKASDELTNFRLEKNKLIDSYKSGQDICK